MCTKRSIEGPAEGGRTLIRVIRVLKIGLSFHEATILIGFDYSAEC